MIKCGLSSEISVLHEGLGLRQLSHSQNRFKRCEIYLDIAEDPTHIHRHHTLLLLLLGTILPKTCLRDLLFPSLHSGIPSPDSILTTVVAVVVWYKA